MIMAPPRSTRTYTLFPYPPLFRSFGANPNSKWDQPRWDMIRAHEAKTDQKFTPAKAYILKGAHLAKARELAAAHHPKWDLLKESAQNLHTRNMGQVLGPELDKPARQDRKSTRLTYRH